MKRHYIAALTVLLALAVSCTRENTAEKSEEVRSLTVALSGTSKTSLGPDQGGVRKVLWKEGDAISVNGIVSNPLAKSYDGTTTAEFTFDNPIQAPYNVLYPAVTGTTISVPAQQNYVKGSFDSNATPLYGCGDSQSIQLHNLCDILRFGFTGSCSLDRMELTAVGNEPVSGEAEMELVDGKLSGNFDFAAGASPDLAIVFPDGGLVLSDTPSEIFIPVIKGTYTQGFIATVIAKNGAKMKLRFFSNGRTLTGSKVLEFPTKPFKEVTEPIYVLNEYSAEEIEFDNSKVIVNATIPEGMPIDETKTAGIVEITPDGASRLYVSDETTVTSGKVKFTFGLEPNPDKASYKYVVVYPSSSAQVGGAAVELNQPPFQSFNAQGCDTEANATVVVTDAGTVQGGEFNVSLNARYGRLKVNIANMPANEVVRNVAVTANNTTISGNYSVDLTSGEISSDFTGKGNTINASPAAGNESGTTVWMSVTPAAVDSWKATLVTDRNIYHWTMSSPFTVTAGQQTECSLDVAQATVQDNLRILLIGNSFTQDACFQLPGVLVGAGITNVEVTQCYYGGRTVPEYNDGWETSSDYTKHTALGGETKMTDTKNVNLKAVAESGRWDIVTIQEHTGNYRAWSWNETEKNHIRQLMEKAAATQEVRPQFYYIMSQTYYDMGKIGSGSVPYITWTDQAGMYDVTVAFAKKVISEIPFVDIVCTGTTLQNLRQTHLKNAVCLTRDGYHMDYGISRYAAACCMYQTIIYPRYGVALSENTYRTSETVTTEGKYTTPITDENAPVAQRAALDAVAHPFEITYQESHDGDRGKPGSNLDKTDHGII